MHHQTQPSTTRALALALVFAAGCENQVTSPPVRLQPSDAIQADKALFKSVLALEPLPGTDGTYSAAYGINDLGQIVGISSSSTVYKAVIWDNSTVPQSLPTLAGAISSSASAISNDGRVIAGTSTDASNIFHPVRWLNANGQWLIDVLPNSGGVSCSIAGISPDGTAIAANCNSVAVVWLNGSRINLTAGAVNGVNGKGQAVGVNSTFDHAVLWTFGNGPVTVTDLGTLGGTFAFANGINDAGDVTGWSENASHVSHAFLWSAKRNAMTDLGPGGTRSSGYGINASGQVVGDVWPGGIPHGGFFDHGKVVDLGVLPGYSTGIAFGLNNTGQAVGWSSAGYVTRATKWILK